MAEHLHVLQLRYVSTGTPSVVVVHVDMGIGFSTAIAWFVSSQLQSFYSGHVPSCMVRYCR
jgi:hypothetical protein